MTSAHQLDFLVFRRKVCSSVTEFIQKRREREKRREKREKRREEKREREREREREAALCQLMTVFTSRNSEDAVTRKTFSSS